MNTEEWLDILAPHDQWNERHLLALFSMLGVPPNLLDVGSGTGAMVNIARKLGVTAWGIDQIERGEDHLFTHDLREPFSLRENGGHNNVAMVLSLEVAEHIEKDRLDIYINTVAHHVKKDGALVFSSAFPGQGGDAHESEYPAKWWRDRFHERGLSYHERWSSKIALAWSYLDSPLFWLAANVQVFKR